MTPSAIAQQASDRVIAKLLHALKKARFLFWSVILTRGMRKDASFVAFERELNERLANGDLSRWFWADCRGPGHGVRPPRRVHLYRGQSVYVEMFAPDGEVALVDAFGECVATLAPWQSLEVSHGTRRGDEFGAVVFDSGDESNSGRPKVVVFQLARNNSAAKGEISTLTFAAGTPLPSSNDPGKNLADDSVLRYLHRIFDLEAPSEFHKPMRRQDASAGDSASPEAANAYADRLEIARSERRR